MTDQPTGLTAEDLARGAALLDAALVPGGYLPNWVTDKAARAFLNWLSEPGRATSLIAAAREALAGREKRAKLHADATKLAERVEAANIELAALRARLRESEARNVDDPQWDATDAALPAWWRGHDHGANAVIRRLRDAVDGKDDGAGVMSGELERLRRDILKLRECEARWKLAEAVCEAEELCEREFKSFGAAMNAARDARDGYNTVAIQEARERHGKSLAVLRAALAAWAAAKPKEAT